MNKKCLVLKTISFVGMFFLCSCASTNERFLTAARDGNLDTVKKFAEEENDIGVASYKGHTALMHAAVGGHTDIVAFLLGKGLDVNRKDADGFTALHHAAMNNRFAVVKLLLANKADVNASTNKGITPLMNAAENSDSENLELLIEHGAVVNHYNPSTGYSALYYAMYEDRVDNVELLLKNGADLNIKFKHGLTPLMYAARRGASKSISFLLNRGVDVNEKNSAGYSALMHAAMYSADLSNDFDSTVIAKLISAGADVSIINVNGQTIEQAAREYARMLEDKRRKEKQSAGNRNLGGSAGNLAAAFGNVELKFKLEARMKKINAALANTMK